MVQNEFVIEPGNLDPTFLLQNVLSGSGICFIACINLDVLMSCMYKSFLGGMSRKTKDYNDGQTPCFKSSLSLLLPLHV